MSKYRCGLSRATERGHSQLRVERRARHCLQPRHELTARSERRKERQVQCVRQAKNVRHQPIVIVDAHLDLLGHRRREQRARRTRGFGHADVAEHDVPPRQQAACPARTSDGSRLLCNPPLSAARDRRAAGSSASRCRRRRRAAAAPRARPTRRPATFIGVATTIRSWSSGHSRQSATRGNAIAAGLGSEISMAKPLRAQEVREPGAHLACAAYDEHALAGAAGSRRDAPLLLMRQRRANQEPP